MTIVQIILWIWIKLKENQELNQIKTAEQLAKELGDRSQILKNYLVEEINLKNDESLLVRLSANSRYGEGNVQAIIKEKKRY